jgi:nucleoside-triphosphatase THEP1
MEKHCSRVVLLTGKRGVGKTTVCQAVAELARRQGYRPGGVITPALYACPEQGPRAYPEQGRRACQGIKVGFGAVDVGSGERWPLAHTDPSTILRQGSGHGREPGCPRVGPYSFDPDGLARALEVLIRAATTGCDLLMVDEIGPLELEQGEGFAPILGLLPVEGPTHTLIVVRPALLDQLLRHWRETSPVLSTVEGFAAPLKVFSVTEENRDELPRRIVEELWGDR